jgi:hypothetical protein
MAELPEELKREVWRRDHYRCQECGVAVAGRNGCKPQTHHIKPKSAGGTDELDNLTTLCLVCHATKDSPNHRKLFFSTKPDEIPSYIKQSIWEVSTNLVVYAESLPALNFPAHQVLTYLQKCQDALESIRKLTLKAIEVNPPVAENEGTVPYETLEELDEIIRGFKLSYWSRHHQQYYDEQVRGAAGAP